MATPTTLSRDQMVEKLGITSLDYESQQQILENVANAVSTRMWLLISEKLNADDLDKLDALIDDDKNDEVEKFIKSKFPSYKQFAIKTENDVIEELSKNMKLGSIEESKKE